jgi:RimJ/RimL family protein N-acetyltransferase
LLETDRLILRQFENGDAAFALELLNEPAFLANIGDRGVRTVEDAVRWIENGPRANYTRLGFGHYVVVLKDTGEAIGMCGLRTRDGLDDPDLGYALLQRHWSRGYAAEAARAVVEYSRAALQLPRLTAICSPDNTSSVAVLEKLGFVFCNQRRLPNENHDVLVFVLDAQLEDGNAPD